jgi:hypothetical protein
MERRELEIYRLGRRRAEPGVPARFRRMNSCATPIGSTDFEYRPRIAREECAVSAVSSFVGGLAGTRGLSGAASGGAKGSAHPSAQNKAARLDPTSYSNPNSY